MSFLQFVNNAGEVLEQGDVVVIASRQPDMRGRPGIPAVNVDLAQHIYDTAVCGVVNDLYAEHKPDPGQEPEADRNKNKTSGRGGHGRSSQANTASTQAFTLDELETLDRTKIAPSQIGHLVAGGICVVCKVDADIAPIKTGELLTTSATKGHAQKVVDSTKAVGAVLGKALGSLKKGKGTIPVLITLQ
jgi:hypothetical protein